MLVFMTLFSFFADVGEDGGALLVGDASVARLVALGVLADDDSSIRPNQSGNKENA